MSYFRTSYLSPRSKVAKASAKAMQQLKEDKEREGQLLQGKRSKKVAKLHG